MARKGLTSVQKLQIVLDENEIKDIFETLQVTNLRDALQAERDRAFKEGEVQGYIQGIHNLALNQE